MSSSKVWGVAAVLAGLGAAGAAQAGGGVSWSVTVGGGGYYPGPADSPPPQLVGQPMYAPAPVYVQPAPVYVQPPAVVYAPRYVPAPVYYQPAPVYVQPAPVYGGGHGGRWHGRHGRGWD